MNVLIIDDESKSRNVLRTIIQDYCPAVDTIEEATDLLSGIKKIHQTQPHLVFLDIEMPGHKGTKIMDFLDARQVNFQLVFTTAYSEYAIKAFELNAIDYLLKPMRPKKVCAAVHKAIARSGQHQLQQGLMALQDSLTHFKFEKIGLPISNGILYVKLSNILFLQAEGMYTHCHTHSHQTLLISKPLKHFVQLLAEQPNFYRTHRSYLVNIQHIKQFVKKDGGYLLMDNGAMVALSKEKQAELVDLLNGVF